MKRICFLEDENTLLIFLLLVLFLLPLFSSAWATTAGFSKLVAFRNDAHILFVRINKTSSGLAYKTNTGIKGSIIVEAKPLNSTHYLALVQIKGHLSRPFRSKEVSGIASSLEELKKQIYESTWEILWTKMNLTLEYVVDVRSNYAWINKSFVGFFPFYIFPSIGYYNATKFTFIHLGEPLKVSEREGKAVPIHVHLDSIYGKNVASSLGTTELACLWLRNKYLEIIFVYHYPILITGWIPLNKTTYMLIEGAYIDESYLPIVVSIDDYPAWATYIDYPRIALVVGVGASVVGLIAYMWRHRKKK